MNHLVRSFFFSPLLFPTIMAQDQQMAKQRVVFSILKFLEKEIQAESENSERRESIEGKSKYSHEKNP